MDELINIIESILGQTINNKITVTIECNKDRRIEIVVKDNLSEICNANEKTTEATLVDLKNQLDQFVAELP